MTGKEAYKLVSGLEEGINSQLKILAGTLHPQGFNLSVEVWLSVEGSRKIVPQLHVQAYVNPFVGKTQGEEP